MSDMRKWEELIRKEINAVVDKGSLTPETMRTIACGVDTIKDIHHIEKMDMEIEEGYSGHYYPQRGYNIMPYFSYGEDGESYRKRDSMGRYSREMREDHDRHSYDRGESKIDMLQRMMDSAKDPEERETYRRLILHEENNQR